MTRYERFPHGNPEQWGVRYFTAFTLAVWLNLAGCPKPFPVPVPPPDANDSGDDVSAPAIPEAAAPPIDATPDRPPTDCELACKALKKSCASVLDTCPSTLEKVQNDRLMRAPDGKPITCARLKTVTTATEARAAGVRCDPL